MAAYYNECDKEKAEWIRQLIKVGIVAPGDVDERSITEVRADDLRGYTQCHFFAGIAVWSYALRLAGWDDALPVWTGSCPCPSFSCAGKGGGFDDPRHLWPDWARLISECRPPVLFGEQSDDAIGYGWLDLVQTDLEASDYAVGKAVLASASVGASDIRQRLYWLADSRCNESRSQRRDYGQNCEVASGTLWANHDSTLSVGSVDSGILAHSASAGSSGRSGGTRSAPGQEQRSERLRKAGNVGNAAGDGRNQVRSESARESRRLDAPESSSIGGMVDSECERGRGRQTRSTDAGHVGESVQVGPLRGFWADAEWIPCRNLKVPGAIEWRPIKPGTFPLAHGAPARVLRLRGYGDAINAEVAKAFIESYMEVSGC